MRMLYVTYYERVPAPLDIKSFEKLWPYFGRSRTNCLIRTAAIHLTGCIILGPIIVLNIFLILPNIVHTIVYPLLPLRWGASNLATLETAESYPELNRINDNTFDRNRGYNGTSEVVFRYLVVRCVGSEVFLVKSIRSEERRVGKECR